MLSSVDTRPGQRLVFCAALAACLAAAGCTLPRQAPAQTDAPSSRRRRRPPVAPATPAPPPVRDAVALLLEHADRVRGLQGAELAQEIARLNDPGAPADQLRLAMALSQTRQLYDLVRAQELLQRVLANPTQEARELHVLARLLGARYAEQRRLEDQLDRQNQQVRELQRRLGETQDKLEALKEIERSLTSRPPAAPASAPAAAPRPPAPMSAPATGAHLLVVDDDADMLRLLTMRLTAAGYRVSAVGSAEAALAQLDIERPQLVLSDVRLPGKDGLALFDDIRARHPSLPVILLTAHGTIPDAVEATERGVFTYLTKPFDGKACWSKIAQALALSAPAPATQAGPEDSWRDAIISRSSRMAEPLAEARMVARSDASVLLRGESGTGKELLAQAIHQASPRAAQPVHRGELRRHSRSAARVRTVRPRQGRLHRRRRPTTRACSRRPTAARCCSTRSATCRWRCRSSCCACCRNAWCGRWAPASRSRSTCASCRPPTATWTPPWPRASSATTCTTASTWSR